MTHYFLPLCILSIVLFGSLVLDLCWLDVNYKTAILFFFVFFPNQPGSIGHSFKDANSAGLFPVSTQFELRSIIGILSKREQNKQFYIHGTTDMVNSLNLKVAVVYVV